MKIAVVGAEGRLGRVISAELASAGHHVSALGHADLDVTKAEQMVKTIADLCPEAIINCSGYNDVDAAEANRPAAFAVNAEGPGLLADTAEAAGAILVHYGTDFIFDGNATEPYTEEAAPNPLNVYGASKLAGECEVRRMTAHYILRVASLFGGLSDCGRRATVDWIAGKLLSGTVVHAVVDRTVSPSYAFDVARVTRSLLERQAPFGTYHCVNSGFTSWHGVAGEIARGFARPGRLEPVKSAELETIAPRPRFCALSNEKLRSLGIDMPTWQSAIRRHLAATAAERSRPHAGAA